MKNNKNFSKISTPLLLFILFLSFFYYYTEHKRNKDASNDVATQVQTYYKNQNEIQFPHSTKIGSSSVLLESSSFAEKSTLVSTIEELQGALSELDKYPQMYSKNSIAAKEIIKNSTISENEKEDMINGLEKSELNPESVRLRENEVATQKAFYQGILSLYQFLLANFKDYQIKPVTVGGDNQISFNTKSNEVKYNQLMSQIKDLAQNYIKADNDLRADATPSSSKANP
jgi:hypothetical protein